MSPHAADHIARLRASTTHKLKMCDLPVWVEKQTTITGRPFRFKNHEYQQRIMSDESQEVVIRKCSQVGISEMSIRMALGLVSLMDAYSVIYTFPTATFASTYVKTRVDPVIQGSRFLRRSISNSVDSSEVKQVGDNFLYFKGAQSGNAAISVSADHLIHDELDFSSMEIIGQYQSRLTHSPFKRKTKLSTPTLPDGPIDQAFKSSRRHWMFVKCNHCNHRFVPNYYEHVKIPGYSGDLMVINKHNLHTFRYLEAQMLCPHCGKLPSLQPEHREWVCENPGEKFLAVGYQVSPFDAPNLISTPYLVEASTQYPRIIDFQNFNLGLPAEDNESGLQGEDMDKAGVTLASSPFVTHVMGADMGLLCRLFIAGVSPQGEMVVVHTEQVPVGQFKERYRALCALYRVTAKVLDSQPYIETVMSLQDEDANLFGAFFIRKDKLELYEAVTREENIEQGKTSLRQVSINRNKAFDLLMDDVRGGLVKIRRDENWLDVREQCCDMRRAKQLNTDGDFSNVWIKSSQKNDHFHHALLYCWIATKLRGTLQGGTGVGMLAVTSFKLRSPTAPGEMKLWPSR